MSRALARHLANARNPAHVYAPRDVIGIRKLLNDWTALVDSHGWFRGERHKPAQLREQGRGDDADTNCEQCVALLDALETIPHAISPEFTAKGLNWFAAMRIQTRPGAPWRDTALTRCFDTAKRDILANFERFEFVGFTNRDTNWYFPIYRVHGNNEQFDYSYGSWQSGLGVYFPEEP